MLNAARALFAPNSQFIAVSLWAMQLLVLIILVRELIAGALRKRKVRVRKAKLLALMSNGQRLQRTAPAVNREDDRITEWSLSVKAWAEETARSLEVYSPQAAAAFAQAVELRRAEYHFVNRSISGCYDLLVQQLDQLRSIMEQPDTYYA